MYEGSYEAAEAFYKKDVHWGKLLSRNSVVFLGNLFCWIQRNILTLFVGTEYEPDKKRSDYNKAYNPSGTLYVIDELYEIDEELKKY